MSTHARTRDKQRIISLEHTRDTYMIVNICVCIYAYYTTCILNTHIEHTYVTSNGIYFHSNTMSKNSSFLRQSWLEVWDFISVPELLERYWVTPTWRARQRRGKFDVQGIACRKKENVHEWFMVAFTIHLCLKNMMPLILKPQPGRQWLASFRVPENSIKTRHLIAYTCKKEFSLPTYHA